MDTRIGKKGIDTEKVQSEWSQRRNRVLAGKGGQEKTQ